MRWSVASLVAAASLLLLSRPARALDSPAVDEELEEEALGPRGNLRTRADDVSFDARSRTLELSGDVRVDAAPFHLRSDRIKLTRTRFGVEVEGKGSLAFCPCLGTPLTVDFARAIVAPPGDLILASPTLRVYGVPVMHLPVFWLRSDEKLGVLPPDIAYRGQDGLFVGEGIHVPFRTGAGKNAIDLRAGAYLVRGFAVDGRLHTPGSATTIRYDRLPGAPAPALRGTPDATDDGLLVDARGATHNDEVSVAWDVDAIRGRRGVAATTDLDAAAKPWDRGAAEGSLGLGSSFVAATGFRSVSRRGGGATDFDAAGPVTTIRTSGAATSGITYDGTVEGGALRIAAPFGPSPQTVSYARAELGLAGATAIGPVATSLSIRGAGDVAAEPSDSGSDRAGSARARLGVPLVRAYETDDHDPWVHAIEPFAEAAVLHTHGDALLHALPGRAVAAIDGTAPITDVGIVTSLGRWARRQAAELAIAGGAAYGSNSTPSGARPLVRGRLASTLRLLGLSADGGWAFGDPSGAADGFAIVTRARLGLADGLRLLANVAARDGIDPVVARALSDAPLEPSAGFLVREGTTGGATIVIPWSRGFTTTFGADGDATAVELVAARAGFELRDRCNCVTLRVAGSRRLGRDGFDAWLALDFATNR
jgi:hypothetical protein